MLERTEVTGESYSYRNKHDCTWFEFLDALRNCGIKSYISNVSKHSRGQHGAEFWISDSDGEQTEINNYIIEHNGCLVITGWYHKFYISRHCNIPGQFSGYFYVSYKLIKK